MVDIRQTRKYEMKKKCNSKCFECLIQQNVEGNNIEKQSNICLRTSYFVLFRFLSNDFLRKIKKQKGKSWVSIILFTRSDIVWWEIPGALVIIIIIGKYSNNNNLFVTREIWTCINYSEHNQNHSVLCEHKHFERKWALHSASIELNRRIFNIKSRIIRNWHRKSINSSNNKAQITSSTHLFSSFIFHLFINFNHLQFI